MCIEGKEDGVFIGPNGIEMKAKKVNRVLS